MAEMEVKVQAEVGATKEDFGGILEFALFEETIKGKSDLIFNVGPPGPKAEKVYAHSVVLSLMSEVFRAMLSETWKKDEEIALPEDDPDDFRMFLKLLYGYKGLKVEEHKEIFPLLALADKYQSSHVQKVLSEFIIDLNKNKLTTANVVAIYLSAKEYDGKDLKDLKAVKAGAKKFILKNINQMWNGTDWLELDEEAVTWILSKDTLCHSKTDIFSRRGCEAGQSWHGCTSEDTLRKMYESFNEILIFGKAIEWIKHKRASVTENGGDEAAAGDDDFAMRVLKEVRFCHITHDDFDKAVKQVHGALTPTEMTNIVLARYGIGAGSSKFISFAKSRVLPRLGKQANCGYCGQTRFGLVNANGQNRCLLCLSRGY